MTETKVNPEDVAKVASDTLKQIEQDFSGELKQFYEENKEKLAEYATSYAAYRLKEELGIAGVYDTWAKNNAEIAIRAVKAQFTGMLAIKSEEYTDQLITKIGEVSGKLVKSFLAGLAFA